jgi:hypothetical protein
MVRGSMFFIFLNFLRIKKKRAAERNGSAEPRLRNPGLEGKIKSFNVFIYRLQICAAQEFI